MTTRRRRALIVAYCFPPNAAIGTHRTLRLVSHLAANGWDVDVLTARPEAYLPGTATDSTLLARVPSNVRVVRSGAFRGFTKLNTVLQPLKRLLRGATVHPNIGASPALAPSVTSPGVKATIEELCAMPDKDIGWALPALSRGLSAFSSTRPDVVFSSAPPWTTHLVAGCLASSFRCRWVADFRDPWVRSEWRRYQSRPAVAIAQWLERRTIQRADAVTFTTRTARDEFATYYGSEIATRLHVVFNGCDQTQFSPAPAFPPGGPFVLLHAGTLYGGRSPMPLIDALADVRREHPQAHRLKLQFLGSTGFAGIDVGRLLRERGLADAVEFLPRVPRDESLRQMHGASALLILQAGTTMAIPGKLYEYLASGKPVFALCEPGEMATFINDNRLGVAVSPDDRAEIARALLALLNASAEPWAPADPVLFDGRLRASELAGVLGSVLPTPYSGGAATVDAGSHG